jgi:hypothetical protein
MSFEHNQLIIMEALDDIAIVLRSLQYNELVARFEISCGGACTITVGVRAVFLGSINDTVKLLSGVQNFDDLIRRIEVERSPDVHPQRN